MKQQSTLNQNLITNISSFAICTQLTEYFSTKCYFPQNFLKDKMRRFFKNHWINGLALRIRWSCKSEYEIRAYELGNIISIRGVLWGPCCSSLLVVCVVLLCVFTFWVLCCAYKWCSIRLNLQLFLGGRMSYLSYLCLFECGGVQHMCVCFVFLRLVCPMLPVSLCFCFVFLRLVCPMLPVSLCFCFVFLRLVCSMLPVSLDCSFFDCPFNILQKMKFQI